MFVLRQDISGSLRLRLSIGLSATRCDAEARALGAVLDAICTIRDAVALREARLARRAQRLAEAESGYIARPAVGIVADEAAADEGSDERSMAGLAAACGLREVRRWFGARGRHARQIPSAERLPAIRAWMRRVGG